MPIAVWKVLKTLLSPISICKDWCLPYSVVKAVFAVAYVEVRSPVTGARIQGLKDVNLSQSVNTLFYLWKWIVVPNAYSIWFLIIYTKSQRIMFYRAKTIGLDHSVVVDSMTSALNILRTSFTGKCLAVAPAR